MKKLNFNCILQCKDNNIGMIARDEVWIEPEPDDGYYLVIEAGRMHIPQKTLWDCTEEQADDLRLWMRNGCVIRMDGIWTCRGKDENVRTTPVVMMD